MATHHLDEQQALALWQRAAELQLAAERTQDAKQLGDPVAGEALSLRDVCAAAEGAGIDPDYVRIALAEQRLPDAREIDRADWKARWMRRLVSRIDAVEHVREVRASPAAVHAALREVVTRPAFNLTGEDTLGDDVLSDGVLVFRRAAGSTSSAFNMSAEWSDIRVVLVTIRALGDGAQLRLRAPLFRRGINLALTGAAGAGGTWFGSAVGAAVGGAGGGAALLLALPMVIGGGAGAALGVAAFRRFYHSVAKGGEDALRTLAAAVAQDAEHAGEKR